MTALRDIVAALRAHRAATPAQPVPRVRGLHAQVPIGDPEEEEGGYDDDDDEDEDEDEDEPDEEDERWELRRARRH